MKIREILKIIKQIVNSLFFVLLTLIVIHNQIIKNSKADSQPSVIVFRSSNNKDGTRSFVTQNGNIDQSLSDLDDLFFEIERPEDIKYTYRIRLAKTFGSSFSNTFNRVRLVLAEPYHACASELENSERLKGNVVLIERGQCSFLTKAINAENAGALAAIITDNDPTNDYLLDMITDDTTRNTNLPTVFLQYKDGVMIKKSIEKYFLRSAVINIPLNLTFKNNHVLKKAPWSVA